MTKYCYLFIFLFSFSTFASLSKLESQAYDLLVKINLQKVDFLNVLNDGRYIQRKLLRNMMNLNHSFDWKSETDVQKLRSDYKSLLNFKTYFLTIINNTDVVIQVEDIFEKNYSKEIEFFSKQLKQDINQEKIEVIRPVTKIKYVDKIEYEQDPIYVWGMVGLGSIVLALIVLNYFTRKKRIIDLNNHKRTRASVAKYKYIIKAFEKSESKSFYLVKNSNVFYRYSINNSLVEIHSIKDLKSNFISDVEYDELMLELTVHTDIGFRYYKKYKLGSVELFDIIEPGKVDFFTDNSDVTNISSKIRYVENLSV